MQLIFYTLLNAKLEEEHNKTMNESTFIFVPD